MWADARTPRGQQGDGGSAAYFVLGQIPPIFEFPFWVVALVLFCYWITYFNIVKLLLCFDIGIVVCLCFTSKYSWITVRSSVYTPWLCFSYYFVWHFILLRLLFKWGVTNLFISIWTLKRYKLMFFFYYFCDLKYIQAMQAKSILRKLKELRCVILQKMMFVPWETNPILKSKYFDRIVYNFLHAGFTCSDIEIGWSIEN